MVPAIIDDRSDQDMATVPAITRAARNGGMRQRSGVIEIALARLLDHPTKRTAELLPWNWKLQRQQKLAA